MKLIPEHYIVADWPAPSNVHAMCTTRQFGHSHGNYSAFNLAEHVGDDVTKVVSNRELLRQELGLKNAPFWLEQTHTNNCVEWQVSSQKINADASFSNLKEQACLVMTADCLPVLFCNKQGSWVASCHAGWRGLLNGILSNTAEQYNGKNSELIAWIGPAITQQNFEVGEEVYRAFVNVNKTYQDYFTINQSYRYQFDFIGLAKLILNQLNISSYGGNLNSFGMQQEFYSYRRDGITGRNASLVWFE